MDKEAETIEKVAGDGLCTGCGTCVGICPEDAIRMVLQEREGFYIPRINEEKCIGCGTCYKVCAGHAVDFKALSRDVFGKVPEDVLIGHYQSCYLGHATDDDLRYNAASGGVITALLLFALDKGIIDGALVVRMKKDRPLEPEPFIARTRKEIIEASKSKYCPVSANIALKEILNSKEGERFAVVGLPCHIQGVRKAENVNKKLREKIVLHIGIFCSHSDTFWQTEFLLSKLGLKEEDIARIDYRGEGWPGRMSLLLKDGRKVSVPFSEAISLHNLWIHALPRCLLCCDPTSELADISCGDPWLPEVLANEKTGKSIIISRTEIGEMLCSKATRNGYVGIERTSSGKVKQSGNMMQTKKKDVKVRFLIHRMFNKPVPVYSTTLLRLGSINYLRAVIVHFNAWISSKTYLRRFISPLSRLELGLASGLRRITQ